MITTMPPGMTGQGAAAGWNGGAVMVGVAVITVILAVVSVVVSELPR
ncbi:hypothetical protein [Streptomyces cahuitamycinicus]|nr:hypothetical protein [Streptomyces cahuitamycinicus]